MQGYNLIVVYNEKMNNILMCKRTKNPYKGLSNFVGGKIELNEDGYEAAYRELFEETAISKNDIVLSRLMDFKYYLDDCYVEVYVGRLNKEVVLIEEVNALYWSSLDCNFYDLNLYAGEGNIGHIIEHVNLSKMKLLK